MTFPAILDTCVLYPVYLCDTLLRLAEAEAYRPLWSADVFTELRRNLVERGVREERVDRRIGEMVRSFPDAMVTGYEALTGDMTNDPKDRHVLAAAVRAHAEVIVTFNVTDFPNLRSSPTTWRRSTLTSSCSINWTFTLGRPSRCWSSRPPPTGASPRQSASCCRCSTALGYRSSPPKSVVTSGRS